MARRSARRPAPDAVVRRIGAGAPALAVECHALDAGEIDVLQTTRVDHVGRRIEPGPIERRNAAVPAELMARATAAELVGLEVISAGDQAKPLRRHEVVQIALAR